MSNDCCEKVKQTLILRFFFYKNDRHLAGNIVAAPGGYALFYLP